MKIGQEIKFKESFKIKSVLGGEEIEVLKGDNALVTGNGYKIINGVGRGKIIPFSELNDNEEIKGFDYRNISKMIYKRLCLEHEINDYLVDMEISDLEFRDSIEDVLIDILE